MKSCNLRHWLTIGLLILAAGNARRGRAELFVLKHGGRIEGKWLNKDEAGRELYEIETLDGGRLVLSAGDVQEVIAQSETLRHYQELLPKVPDTAEGHLKMAEWCRKSGLTTQREYHLRKVLQIDPNHSEARHALGFSRVDGEWIKADEWLQKQGYIRYRGDWRLPQEVELESQNERRSVEEKEWRKRIRVWRSAIVRGRKDAQQALADLRSIDSVLAVPALAELLAERDEPKQLKLLYIEVLGKFRSSAAVAALIKRVMQDGDATVREVCLDRLKTNGTRQAVAVLSRALKDKDNRVVNQAAWALGRLGDPEAIPALIDAVTTKHRFKVQSGRGGNYNVGFSPTSGNSFSTGGGTKIIERELQNKEVHTALALLTPVGIDFVYDKRAWKNWYAHKEAPANFNLRRGR